jgi:protoheme ferro-lyase
MIWISVVFLSLVAGFEAVRYLIAPPADMTRYAAIALLCFFLSAVMLLRLKKISRRLVGLGLMLVCGIAGYLIACAVYLKAPEHEKALALQPVRSSSPGHTAIIYFTHGEPRTYDGSFEAWKHAIHEMDETGVPFVPWPFRPFFFKKVRDEYFEVGGSFHNLIHTRTMERIESAYRQKSDPHARCYIAYSDDSPHAGAAAVQAVQDGADRLILLNVWLTDSDHSESGRKEIEALQPEKYGVKLCVTDTLKNSRQLMRMIVERAIKAAGDMNRADIGILLVAHGQPASWDAIFKKQPVQENSFRQETKKLLEAEGFKDGNIVLAYMEFKQPDIKSAVQGLVAGGVKKILVSPVNISAESIHSEHEIPSMVDRAGVPPLIPVVHLGAWNDDQQLIDALLERLATCQ